MYREVFDADEMFYVCRFSPGGDTDADYRKHLEGMRRAADVGSGKSKRFVVFIAQDPGYPPPSSSVRKEVAEISSAPGYNLITAVVTNNVVIRGVMTAISWLRPVRAYDEKLFASAKEALAWCEKLRGSDLVRLDKRIKELEIA